MTNVFVGIGTCHIFFFSENGLVCGKWKTSSPGRNIGAVNTIFYTVAAQLHSILGQMLKITLCQAKQNTVGESLHHNGSILHVKDKEYVAGRCR